MVANVQIQQVPQMGQRVLRSPQHRWHLRHEAYQIQPFLIAPVLPGETMKRANFKSRVVSDPVKNSLIGWWIEYYFFYVKMRDLAGRDDFTEMLMDIDKDISSYYSAASLPFYHQSEATPDRINWTKLCLQRVVEEYFRDEGETWDTQKIGEIPIAQIGQKSWLDSVVTDTKYAATDIATDDTGATAGELERALQQWEFMRSVGMTDMDYDQFLRTFGVNIAKTEPHKPELLRYVRDWSYPANTVSGAGDINSALSWSMSESIDKDRFFKEHGFIIGVTVARPKVYLGRQDGSAAGLLDNAMAWMPAIMRDEPYTSMRQVTAAKGPLQLLTDSYWVDLRDIYVHGDQFINFALTATDAGIMAIPTAANEKRYAAESDIDALFVDAAGGNNLIRQDGVVTLNILGTQVDQTPKVSG